MLLKYGMSKKALTAGLSVAFLALMTGVSQAQDTVLTDAPEWTGSEGAGDESCDPCAGVDEQDVVIDDEIGGDVGEEPLPDVTTQEFPDSICGGCEYQTMSGGPEVQRDVTGTAQNPGRNSSLDPAAEVISDQGNICYNADLYSPLLCDWQRPFVGDRMP